MAARAHAAEHSWKAATVQLVEHYKAACAAQNVVPGSGPAPAGLRGWTKKLARRTTMWAIRKLAAVTQ